VAETDAHITIVDRHGKQGGTGTTPIRSSRCTSLRPSTALTRCGRKDSTGINAGLYELAAGPEVSAYFDTVMRLQLRAGADV
jgi:hypothetical protein